MINNPINELSVYLDQQEDLNIDVSLPRFLTIYNYLPSLILLDAIDYLDRPLAIQEFCAEYDDFGSFYGFMPQNGFGFGKDSGYQNNHDA